MPELSDNKLFPSRTSLRHDAARAGCDGELLSFFLPVLAAGGAERVVLAIAGEIAGRGYRCDLVTAQDGGRWSDRLPDGVRHVGLGRAKPLHAVPALVRYLRHHRPAAVLSSVFAANIAALIACRMTRTRCIIREAYRVEDDARSSRALPALANRLAVRLLYPRASGVVALSRELATHVVQAAKVDPARVTVIPNPIVVATGPAQVRDPNLILACGRLEAQKDFPTLLRAFALVRRKRPVRLLVVGEGSQLENLRSLAEALGIGGDVTFGGYSPDPGEWMRRAKVLASTSRIEGFPNVLLEALANGCAVVSTRSSDAVDDLLEAGTLGVIVPVGDAEAVAWGIGTLLDRPDPNREANLHRYELEPIATRYLDALLPGRTSTLLPEPAA